MDSLFLPLLEQAQTTIARLPGTLVTFLLCFIGMQVIQALLGVSLRAGRVNRALQGIIQSTVGVILWLFTIALLFHSLGLNQIALALSGSVAIIGLGIATGANKLVSDILAGFFLAKTRDFRIGQRIKMGEIEGTIYSLDSRKVRVMAKDGTLYIIPNTKFDEQMWQIFPEKTK